MQLNKILEDFLQNRPVDSVSIRSEVYGLIEENQRLRNASHISQENKNFYLGKVKDSHLIGVICPQCKAAWSQPVTHVTSWKAISAVLSLVQKRAKLG